MISSEHKRNGGWNSPSHAIRSPVLLYDNLRSFMDFVTVASFVVVCYLPPRTIMLSDLSLISRSKFSVPLITGQLSPSVLLNLAHLAGSLDQHSIPAIFERAHSKSSGTKVS